MDGSTPTAVNSELTYTSGEIIDISTVPTTSLNIALLEQPAHSVPATLVQTLDGEDQPGLAAPGPFAAGMDVMEQSDISAPVELQRTDETPSISLNNVVSWYNALFNFFYCLIFDIFWYVSGKLGRWHYVTGH